MKHILQSLLLTLSFLLVGVGNVWGETKINQYTKTFVHGLDGWDLTNYTDKETYYLVPSGTNPSIATLKNIFEHKNILSNIIVTLNVATYGDGTNPNGDNFSFFNSKECNTNIPATQSGTLPSSSTYTNLTYTISQNNTRLLSNDLIIKITKPGKQIRIRTITIEYTYETETRNISWSFNGKVIRTEDLEYGASIDFCIDLPSTGNDWEFVGWTDKEEQNSTTEKPNLINNGIVTEDKTYYAVFGNPTADYIWTEVDNAFLPDYGFYAICTDNYFMCAKISSGNRFDNGSNKPSINGKELSVSPLDNCIWYIFKDVDGYYKIKNGENYAAGTEFKNQGALITDKNDDLAKWEIEKKYTAGFTVKNYGRTLNNDPDNCFLRNNGANGWATYVGAALDDPRLFRKNHIYSEYATLIPGNSEKKVLPPIFTPEECIFTEPISVCIENPNTLEGEYSIFYSTDGTDPKIHGTLYTTPITIFETTTVKAVIRYIDNNSETYYSDIHSAYYQLGNGQGFIEESWVLTPINELTDEDIIIIVDKSCSRAMPFSGGTGHTPESIEVTLDKDKTHVLGGITDELKWNVIETLDNGKPLYTFFPDGDRSSWLYTFDDSKGIRIGNGEHKYFEYISLQNSDNECIYSGPKSFSDNRYIGVYNNDNWRCYKDDAIQNIYGSEVVFYKKTINRKFTITWSINGESNIHSQFDGEYLTIPTVSETRGKAFYGWVLDPKTVTFNEIPSLANVNNKTRVKGDATYYAVYATKYPNTKSTTPPISDEVNEIPEGEYYLVDTYGDDYYAMSGAVTNGKIPAKNISNAVSVDNGVIKLSAESEIISPEMIYKISYKDGKYIIKNKIQDSFVEGKTNDNNLTSQDGNSWSGIEWRGNRVSFLNSYNKDSKETLSCLLLQASRQYSGEQTTENSQMFRAYNREYRGKTDNDHYGSGYFYLIPAGSTYWDFITKFEDVDIKVSAYEYTTYSSNKAYKMPKGLTGRTVYSKKRTDAGYNLYVPETYPEGSLVPVGESLVLQGTANETYTLLQWGVPDEPKTKGTENCLYGEYGEKEKDGYPTTFGTGESDKYYYYKLTTKTVNGVKNFGWYWGVEDGKPFYMSRNDRAYLVLPKEVGNEIKEWIYDIEDDNIETSIEAIAIDKNRELYDLSGRRIVQKPKRGVYIMDGKKYLVK